MPGHGPRPKPADQRARTNSDPLGVTALNLRAAPQPKLPTPPRWLRGGWPKATRAWWATWGQAAQAELFTQTDWDYLLDTALIHAQLWSGDPKVAAELRLRVAKFGATAEDRARLRYVATEKPDGDQSSNGRGAKVVDIETAYSGLTLLPGAGG